MHRFALEDDVPLLEESLRLLGDQVDRAVGYFYAGLFLERPDLRLLFPAAMDTQRDRLFRALTGGVRHLDDAERFVPMFKQLGRDHRKYGVQQDHYDAVRRALIAALRKYLDGFWVPELEDAWERAYDYMATTMMAGAEEAAGHEPAFWNAEIIAHERRADDIAVITVRTDQPYPYTAGQFASVETPYRPKSWRTYSLATAPQPDGHGLLEFHVRALSHGWVSGPLVWRATVGDVLTLGAPMGEMAVDKDSDRDVICVAGGTGLAPIKAIVEDMARWNTTRRVHVFFGVRRSLDLYDIGALHRLAALHRWLTVVPAVSDEPGFAGERGTLPEVITRHGGWHEHDAVVCGSPAMTRATMGRLADLGVPADRFSYDTAGEEHPATAQVIDLRTRAPRARVAAGGRSR